MQNRKKWVITTDFTGFVLFICVCFLVSISPAPCPKRHMLLFLYWCLQWWLTLLQDHLRDYFTQVLSLGHLGLALLGAIISFIAAAATRLCTPSCAALHIVEVLTVVPGMLLLLADQEVGKVLRLEQPDELVCRVVRLLERQLRVIHLLLHGHHPKLLLVGEAVVRQEGEHVQQIRLHWGLAKAVWGQVGPPWLLHWRCMQQLGSLHAYLEALYPSAASAFWVYLLFRGWLVWVWVFYFVSWDRVVTCNPGWAWTCYVAWLVSTSQSSQVLSLPSAAVL